jgi:alpha-tubulin suppressor-like RCC1 family protein
MRMGGLSTFFGTSGANVVEVAAGEDHTLVRRNDNTVHGWGCNTNNQITIPALAVNSVSIAAGRKMCISTCML